MYIGIKIVLECIMECNTFCIKIKTKWSYSILFLKFILF